MVENRLKAILADRHKTCKWLAQEIKMSENTISRWCSNRVQLLDNCQALPILRLTYLQHPFRSLRNPLPFIF
ncbi:MAG: helix-turn-helix domain-containing protein [Bacteroidaceae bacterium]|nr:helix-turn-helix domain-containing protein [Bacteroidaceae bacterium]